MPETGPQPSIQPPKTRIDLLYTLVEQTESWMDCRDSTDDNKQAWASIALANLNLCLDYYPNGSPRDHLVVYGF